MKKFTQINEAKNKDIHSHLSKDFHSKDDQGGYTTYKPKAHVHPADVGGALHDHGYRLQSSSDTHATFHGNRPYVNDHITVKTDEDSVLSIHRSCHTAKD